MVAAVNWVTAVAVKSPGQTWVAAMAGAGR
jgi:hypothetical protein